MITLLAEKYPEYTFTPGEVIKNGDVKIRTISVGNNTPFAPQIYIDQILEKAEGEKEALDLICNIIENNMSPDIDITKLMDKEFVLDHIRIGIQHCSNESVVKHCLPDFPGLEAYLYIMENSVDKDTWSVKIKTELLEKADIDEELAWETAELHTSASATIMSIGEVLSALCPFDNTIDVTELDKAEMFVISNKEKCKGAASITDMNLLRNFAEKHDCKKIAVLPSSIHECILLPLREDSEPGDLTALVREVNATQLAPEEVLIDKAYILEF